ncbi:poly(hydroxyalkanoate) granule-associated protein [Rhizobium laguerreae]|uniref:poly(hydroxyalkanoate) granule-associated protein n=1 Tax=Rhizobium laguerreae TaxID=1076926 RepID=UPI0014410B43|nr:poly(hydroxyalkanoate) granule-associated protein [Rhizobium laguerreae]MBY3209360.1 poly(hydroxyalkanoate) granule-associated protein [Rhizobium laguerreae]MBY3387439.1 poly(hydroxyalkanoate) granule-associated protein [Rhizobium laguerreae]MBY3401189.1 poly(hydroxyalkanoate) granule-associated protein [Rhizobium laguerreae]MBY3408127.1 poly(hydroxyalkanoate) granule-associated protein [Rhizobium laguerreae]NKN16416.1 poly(hydroxyalkanoate) granule-associated protein [Rhizobium laguerreae]
MIRYATSAAGNPMPPKAREVSATEPAVELPRTKPVIEVDGAVLAAYPLLPGAVSDEIGSDIPSKTTKSPRRAATKRKPKVAEADTPPQLNLEA